MIPWSHVHSFMRDRSSIWRRVTVAAETGPREAIITDNCGRLTPRPTRGSLLSMLYAVYISWHWCSGREQYDRKGGRKKARIRGRPVVWPVVFTDNSTQAFFTKENHQTDKGSSRSSPLQIVSKWFWEREERGWTLEGIFFLNFL